MTNSEGLLRTILGPIRPNIRPLALAIDVTDDLLFSQHISLDDILVTKNVYPDVARLTGKRAASVSRSVGRLAHRCWDCLDEHDLTLHYLGRTVKQEPAPRDLLIYFAVFAHLDIPFFAAVEQHRRFLLENEAPLRESFLDCIQHSYPLAVSHVMIFSSSFGTTSYPVCPACFLTMEREYQCFCDRCGQRLNWEQFDKAHVVYPGHDFGTA